MAVNPGSRLKRLVRFLPFSSLTARIFAIFWFTLLLVIISVLVVQHQDPRNYEPVNPRMAAELNEIAGRVSKALTRQPGDMITSLRALSRDHRKIQHMKGIKLYFTDTDGVVLDLGRHSDKFVRNFASSSDDPKRPLTRQYGPWQMAGPFVISDGPEQGWMYIGRRLREPPPFLIRLLDNPVQLLLATMLVSTPLLLWLAWAVTRPARRLQMAAERVAKGEFSIDPLLEKGPREFRQAGASFNQMVGAVDSMITGQQRLLSDISHELRSPLTRLRMANALAIRKQGESKELSRIDTEADRLEQMIADLLSLSRMQVNSHESRELTDAESLWLTMLEDAQFEAEQHNQNLEIDGLEAFPLLVNLPMMCSALENVIRNAIKYADSKVSVSFSCNGQRLEITVDDDGCGVPDEELNDIFRPFYRVSTARDRQSGGTGLGLAITENAVRQHSGSVSASRSHLGGLQVSMYLPLANIA
ncbi:envelope stress sensor histidine kinase CpxA [Parasalinivibrio latis]|uniref:envelope stress sensor histidine kinase CpxA n=1 Tax=Parasalinivibrio latis TaxID=2952610 RepID=UPI0030E2EC53